MKLEILRSIIMALENLGLKVVATVSDMAFENESMWKKAGVSDTRTWIDNPATRQPIRQHIVHPAGGLLIPREGVDGGPDTALLSQQCFREVLQLNPGELRICHKLTDLHLDASGQKSQRVNLATQLLSHSVAAAMREYLPRRQAQAAAIETFDQWFDVFNSRTPYGPKLTKCAYGVADSCMRAQNAALESSESLIRQSRKCVKGTRRRALLPCQLEGDAEFLTTGQLSESTSSGSLSSEALEGLTIPA
ncbi:Transposable element P transposase [Amphibalanus amphitrite]|uniref:Transposable element P transposase n=1 Tax=Amphibalanus amphitrite TaxID=1232801 RepID=A0A6A4X812_AMPAM|nr:Transposable element P transposase [Amphibalanus amphitrite]